MNICIWDVVSAQSIDLRRDPSVGIKKLDFYRNKPDNDSITLITELYRTTEELPEILIYKNNKINAAALSVIPHEVEKLTLNEKKGANRR